MTLRFAQSHVFREVWPAVPHEVDVWRHYWTQACARSLARRVRARCARHGRLAGCVLGVRAMGGWASWIGRS